MSGLPLLPDGTASASDFADATLARIDAEIKAERAILVALISDIEEAVRVGRMAEAEVLLTVLPDHVLGNPRPYFSSSCLLGVGHLVKGLRDPERAAPGEERP